MPFNPSLLTEKLRHRDYDFFIYNENISEVIFNGDEIILKVIRVQKSEIPDFTSFIISAMGVSGSDECDMQNAGIISSDQVSMQQTISDFQTYWKIDLGIETYIKGDIRHIYEMDTDPSKKGYGSEISYGIETTTSFVYFFTHHFYY